MALLIGLANSAPAPAASALHKAALTNLAPKHFPIAKIGESKICCPGDSISLDGWASIEIGGDIMEWLWDYNGDSKVDTITKTGELVI
ncbi:MAG: hypothetical protein PHC61_06595, partial [Chitinivibrionales bacterium]|nr:hypothetical protein [Chitinivibrionales bacterium]